MITLKISGDLMIQSTGLTLVFHELVDKNILSPGQVVDILKYIIPMPITRAIDEVPETCRWLFQSISSSAASGKISDRALTENIVNISTSGIVETDMKLAAMESLIEIGN